MRAHLAAVRLLLLRLHFYAGLLVGPFVLLVAATGLVYATVPQLEALAYAHELRVPGQDQGWEHGTRRLPLADQLAAAQHGARAAFGGGAVLAIRPATAPRESTRVVFGSAGADQPERTVFVDPYTREVLGTLPSHGGQLPLRAWVDGLHRTLHLGAAGRLYSELATSWLWVLGVSGAVVWTARVRRRRRLRRLLVPGNSGVGRRRLLSWHGVIGLWAVAGILLVSGTGLTMTRYAGANIEAVHQALRWNEPTVAGTPLARRPPPDVPSGTDVRRSSSPPGDSEPAAAQHVLDGARRAGMTGPMEIRPPGRPGDCWVVRQVHQRWPTRLDQAAVDPASGAVVREIRFADWPMPVKVARWTAEMHTGTLFGRLNQALLGLLSLAVLCLVVWGYRMWWLRGRGRGGWARAPGAAVRPTRPAMLTVAVLGVALGLLLPVLGVSLLVMLLVDSVVVALRPGETPARDVAAVLSMQEPPRKGDP